MKITIRVPMSPIAKPRPRSARIGSHTRVYTPTGGKVGTFIASVRMAASEAYSGPPLDGPLRVDCEFVFPMPQRLVWKTRPMPRERHTSKPDRDNLDKQILDSLNGIVWRDDSQVCEGWIAKWIAGGDEQPHALVVVSRVEK